MRTLFVLCVTVGLTGCGSSAPAPTRRSHEDDLKEAFVVAREFLVAVKANDTDAALARADTPFLLGGSGDPKRLEARDELAARFADARSACGGPEFPTTTVLLTPLRPEDAAPAERPTVERWLAITGPGGQVMSTGDPLAPGPVKLLMRIDRGRVRVVGLLY